MENIDWGYVIGISGISATILTAGIGVWYLLFVPKLKYFVEILPFVSPSNVDKNIKNKLKITYNEQEVKQLNLVRITIYNKGRAIAENFSSPIAIKFNNKILYAAPNKKILTSGIINEYTISRDNTKIEFMPKFINQGENLSFDIVLELTKDIDITVTGRCKGCSNIKKIKSKKYLVNICSFILGTLFPLVIIGIIRHQTTAVENISQSLEEVNIKTKEHLEQIKEQNDKVIAMQTQCSESKKICSQCKKAIIISIEKNISLSSIDKNELISQIEKYQENEKTF